MPIKDKFANYKCPMCGCELLFEPDDYEDYHSGKNIEGDFVCINDDCLLNDPELNDKKEKIN